MIDKIFIFGWSIPLSLQYTVMHIFLYFIFCSLYLIFYLFNFMYISSVFVFYNICTGADLTHISLLVNTLYIIVYVTNKNLES